jgi:hypothetical protein
MTIVQQSIGTSKKNGRTYIIIEVFLEENFCRHRRKESCCHKSRELHGCGTVSTDIEKYFQRSLLRMRIMRLKSFSGHTPTFFARALCVLHCVNPCCSSSLSRIVSTRVRKGERSVYSTSMYSSRVGTGCKSLRRLLLCLASLEQDRSAAFLVAMGPAQE